MTSLENRQEYYATHGIITDPGARANLFGGIPDDIPEIVRVVQGLFLHVFWAERYGVTLTEAQKQHVQTRSIGGILEVLQDLDAGPLTHKRPFERRFIGNCRDHSVFMCAILRSKGIAARARCGFARYFRPEWFEDHWICEYWNGSANRWVAVDAQLDQVQREALHILFDPLDLPRGQFVSGAEAWQMCRAGLEDPEQFGIFDMHGLWFVRGDFLRDIAALNKMELLPWDVWGLMERDDASMTHEDLALLDKAAALVVTESPELYHLYEAEPGLKVPRVIHSYTPTGPVEVAVGV